MPERGAGGRARGSWRRGRGLAHGLLDAGAALFAAAFYKRAFDQADAVADPNIAPAASAFLGATQDVLAPRAAAFVAQAPRSPACPTRGGGGSVDIEMDGSGRKGMDGSGPLSPKNTDRAVPSGRPESDDGAGSLARSARFAPEIGDVEMDGRGAPSARGATARWTARRGADSENVARAVPVLAVPKATMALGSIDVEMDGSRRSVGSRRSGMDSSAASQRTSLDGSVYDLPCSLSIVDDADQVLPPEKQSKRPKLGLQRATAPRYALKDPACESVDPATGREVITTTRNAVFVEAADPTDDALDFLSGLLERDAAPAPPPRRQQVAPDSTPVLRSTGGGYEVVAEGRVFGGPWPSACPSSSTRAGGARARRRRRRRDAARPGHIAGPGPQEGGTVSSHRHPHGGPARTRRRRRPGPRRGGDAQPPLRPGRRDSVQVEARGCDLPAPQGLGRGRASQRARLKAPRRAAARRATGGVVRLHGEFV